MFQKFFIVSVIFSISVTAQATLTVSPSHHSESPVSAKAEPLAPMTPASHTLPEFSLEPHAKRAKIQRTPVQLHSESNAPSDQLLLVLDEAERSSQSASETDVVERLPLLNRGLLRFQGCQNPESK